MPKFITTSLRRDDSTLQCIQDKKETHDERRLNPSHPTHGLDHYNHMYYNKIMYMSQQYIICVKLLK